MRNLPQVLINQIMINLLYVFALQAQAVFGRDPRSYGLAVTEFRAAEKDASGEVAAVVVRNPHAGKSTTEDVIPADLVILAMGFVSPETSAIHSQLDGLQLDQRNNIHAIYGEFSTTVRGVFAAGDCRRGQSLVVWAINEGRGAAQKCHEFLCGR